MQHRPYTPSDFEITYERSLEWQCSKHIIEELKNLSVNGELSDFTQFIYRFISYNTLYSFLKNRLMEGFASDRDAVGKPIASIKKWTDTREATTLIPCYLGHEITAELLLKRRSDIEEIIQAVWTESNHYGLFKVFSKSKDSKGFWKGRATRDSESVELIEYHLGVRQNLSDALKIKLTETNGRVTEGLFCETVLMLIYQTRCNLFHGSKKTTDKQSMILAPMHRILNRLIDKTIIKIDISQH